MSLVLLEVREERGSLWVEVPAVHLSFLQHTSVIVVDDDVVYRLRASVRVHVLLLLYAAVLLLETLFGFVFVVNRLRWRRI